MSGVMRTQANGIDIPAQPRAQIWDEEVLPHWRRWAKLRTQLYPYLAAADAEYRRSGLPIMRHLALAYPDDPSATAVEDAFLFGPDLLAAPVLDAGRARALAVPAARRLGGPVALGRATARATAASSSAARGCSSGGRTVTVPAPLGELPLLARAGTLLSLLPPGRGHARLVRRRRPGGVRWPSAPASACCSRSRAGAPPRGSRTAASSARTRGSGRWKLAIRSERRIRWALQASLRTLRRPFVPCSVALDGRRLPASAWDFDDAHRGALRAPFRAARRAGRQRLPALTARRRRVRPRAQEHTRPRPRAMYLSQTARQGLAQEEEPCSTTRVIATHAPHPVSVSAPAALFVSLMVDSEQPRRPVRAGRRRFRSLRRHS